MPVRMKATFKLACLVFATTLMVLYGAYAENYTVGEIETEKLFRQYYPETKNLSGCWEWAEALTPKTLRQLCDDVLQQLRENELTGFIKEYEYYPVNTTKDLLDLRVIRDAPFFSFLKAEQEMLTVAICHYDKIKFYVTKADENHVFRLWVDAAGFFALQSGLHPISVKI